MLGPDHSPREVPRRGNLKVIPFSMLIIFTSCHTNHLHSPLLEQFCLPPDDFFLQSVWSFHQGEDFGCQHDFFAEHEVGEPAAEEQPGEGAHQPDHGGREHFEEAVAHEVGDVYVGGRLLSFR